MGEALLPQRYIKKFNYHKITVLNIKYVHCIYTVRIPGQPQSINPFTSPTIPTDSFFLFFDPHGRPMLLHSLPPSQGPPLMLSSQGSWENFLSSFQGCYHFFFLLAKPYSQFVRHLFIHFPYFRKPWGSRLILWVVSVSYCCITNTNITVAYNRKYFSPYA